MEDIEEITLEHNEENGIVSVVVWSDKLKHNNTSIQANDYINSVFIEDIKKNLSAGER